MGKDQGNIVTSPASGTLVGDQVRLTAVGAKSLQSKSFLQISDAGGILQAIEIHTSCSQPLRLGDEFGALKIVEMTDKNGLVLSLADPNSPIFFGACEVPSTPPEPHCTSKVIDLGLRYIGGDCTVTNSQEGKGTCTGVNDPGQPASITIINLPGEVTAVPAAGIACR